MNRTIRWLSSLLMLGFAVFSLRAASPDLSSAPPPKLSDAAWQELQQPRTGTKEIALHAQITAAKGAITDVTVREAAQWPQTSAEVAAWIKQHWKFVLAFSGTADQPIAFKLLEKPSGQTPAHTGRRTGSAKDFFESAPKSHFPHELWEEVRDYREKHNNYEPGVLLSITAQNGAITDIRVIDVYSRLGAGTLAVKAKRQRHIQNLGIL